MRARRTMARIRYALVVGALLMTATPTTATADPVGSAGQDGLVDVRDVVPDALIDLRYATPDNFLGVRMYPVGARCLVHESLAPGLAAAAESLRAHGNRLVFWDCYRPHAVQVRMFEAVPDPSWVARPGNFARSHTAGRSVDVTLSDDTVRLLDMGTDFDEFSSRATAFATDGVSWAAQANRARLRRRWPPAGLPSTPVSGGTSTGRARSCSARSSTCR